MNPYATHMTRFQDEKKDLTIPTLQLQENLVGLQEILQQFQQTKIP